MMGYIPGMSDRTTFVIEMLVYLPWAAFSGMRAYALCRSRILSILIFCLSVVPIVVNWANFWYGLTGLNVSFLGCTSNVLTPASVTRDFGNQVTLASRLSLIIADCVLVVITWRSVSQTKRLRLSANTFSTVLLRDGETLLALNSLHLILTELSQLNGPSLQEASFVSLFAELLTAILVSRFLLHLQSAKHRTVAESAASFTMDSTSLPDATSIRFGRVLGSLDQSLSPEDYFGEGEDLDDTSNDPPKVYGMPEGADGREGSSARSAGYEVIELLLRAAASGDDA
ncbi:hypothetical protein BD309DRAFT_973567 [Dichomitus squalens]|nr:hypothetical protein BD309DRAFT_973567 [Dichomitus squalens]